MKKKYKKSKNIKNLKKMKTFSGSTKKISNEEKKCRRRNILDRTSGFSDVW